VSYSFDCPDLGIIVDFKSGGEKMWHLRLARAQGISWMVNEYEAHMVYA
jgi:hypothetical protein